MIQLHALIDFTSMSDPKTALQHLCFVICICAFSRSASAELFEIRGQTMGTTYSVKWIGESRDKNLKSQIDQRLIEINKLMSTYDPTSELSLFNASKSTDWIEASTETAFVVDAALEIGKLSDGAFDPTVGRLVRMWNFGKDPKPETIPSQKKIVEALKSVGFQYVEVRLDPPAIRKSMPAIELDLSAIAKGYAVDSVAELLVDSEIHNFMVEIGGEVITSGEKEDGPWVLGIQRPETTTGNLSATIALHDRALATSGDYRNFYERDGVRYSHTIDPRTGFPVTHQLASASVVADSCMLADAWATTLMVLGPEEGMALAEEQKVAAYFLNRKDGSFEELITTPAVGLYSKVEQPAIADANNSLVTTFLIALTVFGIATIGLASGVILSNRSLKGSCGGAEGLKDEQGRSICDMCTTPPEECDQFREKLRESEAAISSEQ